ATGAPLAKRLGFTAVQLPRGGDPAPLRALELGYYLDQPIGKGLLELRDEEWIAVRTAYESTRDPAKLVRPNCFAAPGTVAEAALEAAAETRRAAGPGLRFVAVADEPSTTRHDGPLDTCRCGHCLAAFRTFLAARVGSVDAANELLGTTFRNFADVVPPTVDQIRRRELGDNALPRDLRAYGLWLEFVDSQYAAAVRTIVQAAQREVPTTPVGLTGTQAPAAFGGTDYARWLPALTLVEPYDYGGAGALVQSLAAPGTHRYATLAAPDESQLGNVPLRAFVQARVAAMACSGLAGVVVWNDTAVAAKDGAPTPFGGAVQAALQGLERELDACAGATPMPSSVWLLESQPSVRAWWMLDSAQDGMTWVRRLPSYEALHSTSQNARLGWVRLLQDLGLQPQFVDAGALPERLLRLRPRCLVLPATLALSDRAAQAIEAYVRQGGVVLADHATGLYDETLRRREAGVLDAMFGITARSLLLADQRVREGACTSTGRALPFAEQGLRGELGERGDLADTHVERTIERGRAVYLNFPVVAYPSWRLDPKAIEPAHELRKRVRSVLHAAGVEPECEVRGAGLPTCIERSFLKLRDGRIVLAVRVAAMETPSILQQLAKDGPRAVQIEFLRPVTLRRLDGEVVGQGTTFAARLDPLRALFFEVAR
ncbi:MAG: beta-galactosidase, partial [Planctomycetes bacterium]|nr:beta-galactosidase [Planctomycetota bacterium]